MSARTSRTVSTVPSSWAFWRSLSVSLPLSDTRRDLVLLERAHRALVVVLGRDEIPDAEQQGKDDRQRRVVDQAGVEAVVPGQAGRRVRQVEGVHAKHEEADREDVDQLVATAQVPRPGVELVALPEPQVDRDDVGQVQADGADAGD